MTTKLTLSINEETVKRAKLVSRKRGKSISKMVEEFLNSISEKEKQSAVDKISGILKGKISEPNLDWKKVKAERIAKKYSL